MPLGKPSGISAMGFSRVVLFKMLSEHFSESDIMCLKELMQRRAELLNQLASQIYEDTTELILKAECMAECATNIKGQGYTAFISAREDFLHSVENFRKEIACLCNTK